MSEVTKGQGLVGTAPIPGYSRGGRVVHGPLCVPARLACPSPHANQVHPVQKKKKKNTREGGKIIYVAQQQFTASLHL